jgi:hypothetical protein
MRFFRESWEENSIRIKMTKYWFAPKIYGYGYVPISVEGWLATLILILIGMFLVYLNNFFNPYEIRFYNGLLFLAEILVLGFVFVKLFEKKCKGKLCWRWGK